MNEEGERLKKEIARHDQESKMEMMEKQRKHEEKHERLNKEMVKRETEARKRMEDDAVSTPVSTTTVVGRDLLFGEWSDD